MGLLGVLISLGLLIWLAYRGWSILLLAPAAALLAAAFAREPLLAHWTQTFMGSAAQFLAQFFPLFLLGALFGKLMDDSGCVSAISSFMTERLGPRHAIVAVVLAGALGSRLNACRVRPVLKIIARSTTLRSSRAFPGQSCCCSRSSPAASSIGNGLAKYSAARLTK